MSMSIEFQTDGRVRIYKYDDGDVVSVTADANKLQAMMPGAVFDEMRNLMTGLLDITGSVKPRLVGTR